MQADDLKYFVFEDFECCFWSHDGNTWNHNNVPKSQTCNQCQAAYITKYMAHTHPFRRTTHPQQVNYYPSGQDILHPFEYQNHNPRLEFNNIITPIGIWTVEYPNIIALQPIHYNQYDQDFQIIGTQIIDNPVTLRNIIEEQFFAFYHFNNDKFEPQDPNIQTYSIAQKNRLLQNQARFFQTANWRETLTSTLTSVNHLINNWGLNLSFQPLFPIAAGLLNKNKFNLPKSLKFKSRPFGSKKPKTSKNPKKSKKSKKSKKPNKPKKSKKSKKPNKPKTSKKSKKPKTSKKPKL